MEDFIKRLTQLLEHFEHTASSFSDTVGVQRSSLSHLLSGRNKPSLDLIMKIHERFPEVNLYWLLKGELPFLYDEEIKKNTVKKQEETEDEITEIPDFQETKSTVRDLNIPEYTEAKQKETTMSNLELEPNNPIEQIVVFYKNGTFKNFNPTR